MSILQPGTTEHLNQRSYINSVFFFETQNTKLGEKIQRYILPRTRRKDIRFSFEGPTSTAGQQIVPGTWGTAGPTTSLWLLSAPQRASRLVPRQRRLQVQPQDALLLNKSIKSHQTTTSVLTVDVAVDKPRARVIGLHEKCEQLLEERGPWLLTLKRRITPVFDTRTTSRRGGLT